MKFPTNIVLDWSSDHTSNSSRYWLFKYLELSGGEKFMKFSIQKTPSIAFFKKLDSLNLKYKSHPTLFGYFAKKIKHASTLDFKASITNRAKYKKNLNKLFKNMKQPHYFKTSSLWNLFDINFIRKEKIYTKLKYSRVPQYDIVSGGSAALFAGFLGFLICEKFGFELLDSGDFYTAVMYVVFFCFSLRIFLKIFSSSENTWSVLSVRWFFLFYRTVFILITNRFIFFK